MTEDQKNTEAESKVARAAKGGKARAQALSAEQRKDIASRAAIARWTANVNEVKQEILQGDATSKIRVPTAKYKGILPLVGIEIPCYVLDTGERVIGRTSVT